MKRTLSQHPGLTALTRLPLVVKIATLLALLLTLSLVITSALFDREMGAYRQGQQLQLAELIGKQTAEVSASQILAQDWVSLTVSANQLAQLALVSGVEILDAKQQPLAQSGTSGERVQITPIELSGTRLGEVRLHLNEHSLAELSIAFYRTTLAAIITSLACWLLLFAYIRRLRDPLKQLLLASDALRRGLPMAPIDCRRDDELGRIAANLNQRFAPSPAVTTEASAAPHPNQQEADPQESNQQETASQVSDPPEFALTPPVTAPNTSTEAPSAPERSTASDDRLRYLLFVDHLSTASENLSSDERKLLLQPYQRSLEQVSGLYRGEFSLDDEGNWWVGFSALDGEQSHGINALCAATLFNALYRGVNQRAIRQMQPVANIKMALMSGSESFAALLQEAEALCRSVEANELIVDEGLFAIQLLDKRLLGNATYRKLAQPARLLSSLAPDYQDLIDKQAHHFLNQS